MGGSERPRGGEGRGTGGVPGAQGEVPGAAGRCAARVRAAGGGEVSWRAISSKARSRSGGFLLRAAVQPHWYL